MCLYPNLIKNKKYLPNRKNGGKPPPIKDKRTEYVPVGCGNCIECRKQKARAWQVRLQEEIKTNTNGKFITLTFNDESIKKITEIIRKSEEENESQLIELNGYELDHEICRIGIRRFLERWRKKYKKSVKHWLVNEIGHNGTENIHLHGIIWTNENYDTIESIWQYGYIWPTKKLRNEIKTYVNEKTIMYMSKYVTKQDLTHKDFKSKIYCSAGIGSGYENTVNGIKNKYNNENTIQTYKTRSGHQINLPIYYRNKIYTEEQREMLWLQLLDKETRYVCGEIAKTDDEYHKLVAWHRERNKRFGYGTSERDMERKAYEKQRRIIQHETRIRKAEEKERLRRSALAGSNPAGGKRA